MRTQLVLVVAILCCPSEIFAGHLTVLERGELPTDLHPLRLYETREGVRLSALVTERLSYIDPILNVLTYTFFQNVESRSPSVVKADLRQNLKWSDGAALTADDIQSSFERLSDMAQRENAPPGLQAIFRATFLVERIVAISGEQIQIEFRQPVQEGEVPSLIGMIPVLPKGISNSDLNNVGAKTCGPFIISASQEGSIELSPNPFYHAGKPYLSGVTIRRSDSQSQERLLLAEGSGELTVSLEPGMWKALRKRADITLRPVNTKSVFYIGYNLGRGSLIEALPELRGALASLIDRQGLRETILSRGGVGPLLTGPFGPDSPYLDARVEPAPYSVPIAMQRLADLGYRRMGESIRNENGDALRLRILFSDQISNIDLIERVLVEQLTREGVEVLPRRVGRTELNELIRNPRGDFELLVHEFVLDEGEDIFEIYHSRGVYNFLGYANDAVDERLSLGRRATQVASKRLYGQEVHRLLSADSPALFLWEHQDMAVMRSDIVKVPPLDPYFLFRNIHLWAVGEGESVGDRGSNQLRVEGHSG